MYRMRFSRALLAGISMLAIVTEAQADEAADAPASGEITVTAERTDRTLRETAASVSVVTGSEIDALAGTYSTDDVLSRMVNVVTTRPASNGPAVRGIDGTGPAIGGDAFFGGTRPRVIFQVDNRTLTFNEAIYIDGLLWDTQQVEVYRGPQSTLQGRNAIGGVIAVKTVDPSFDWSGKVRGVVGEDKVRQFSGSVGGPIVPDVLAFRVAADWRTEEAFVDFEPFVARDAGINGEFKEINNPERSESLTLRGKLLFTPTPDVRALVTLTHLDAFAPQSMDVARPFQDHIAAYPLMPRFQTRSDAAVADLSFGIADGISLTMLGIYTDFRIKRFAALLDGNALIDGKEWSVEPRLRFGSPDDTVSGFIAGLVYRTDQNEEIDIFDSSFKDSTDTNAVFGELLIKPTQSVGITLAARYESEKRFRLGGGGPFFTDFDRKFNAFLPRLTVTIDGGDVTYGATIGRGYNSGGAGFTFFSPFEAYSYDKETVTNVEGFVRASLADGRLSLQGNVFYNDYKGLQLPFDLNPDPDIFATVINNADKATTYGAELEARFRALDSLTIWGSAGLLKAKINRYAEPEIEGNELARAPAFTFNAGLVAKPIEAIDVSFDMRYTDTYYSDVFNDARGKVRPYVLANAQIAWTTGPARLFVAATNLFNTTDVVLQAPGATFADDSATITRPRRVTAGVELSF
jgi:outer membrane receptor protein involved in Fe transport